MKTIQYSIFAILGLSLIGFSSFAYAESGSMSILDQTVDYDIENGQVVDIYLDVDFVELILDFVAVDDGIVEITIPRGLLDSKLSETEDDIFFILVDGFETEYIEIESAIGTRTLVIPFFGGDEQIEIIGTTALEPVKMAEIEIPGWVKNNAGWWSEGVIPDSDFVSGIQYMITNGIMTIPETESGQSTSADIPGWVKNNAGWWSEGKIPDSDFVSGIQYLITNGIIGI
ncbi:hypothetical protein C6988_01245 [Nitrosopumilus sp. b1]|uniref:hypothetical protein n=1 Tax=Nitrosopumilus sp. b1 TaxID=2109907 RepID=UPI0015F4C977|nr:hypothetical protein [Nitrosopumilus sp. b1]KAF6243820.1 hypothetical protein C6988_01245 [Nitrosopumilus sp. b1]